MGYDLEGQHQDHRKTGMSSLSKDGVIISTVSRFASQPSKTNESVTRLLHAKAAWLESVARCLAHGYRPVAWSQ